MLNLQAAGFSQGKGFGLHGQDSVDPCCLFTSIQRPLFSCLHSLILSLKVTARLKLLHWQRKYFPPPQQNNRAASFQLSDTLVFNAVSETFALSVLCCCFSQHPHRDVSQNQCGAILPSVCTEGFAPIYFSKPLLGEIPNEKHQSLTDRSASVSVNISGRS